MEGGSGVSEDCNTFDSFIECSFLSDIFDDDPGEVGNVGTRGMVGIPGVGFLLGTRGRSDGVTGLEVFENDGRGDETSTTCDRDFLVS